MRFHESFDDLLGNQVRVRLLRILVRTPGHALTGREIARRASTSPSQTIAALEQLESSGIVFREVVGRSHAWRLSEDHDLTPPIRALFAAELGSLARLRTELLVGLKGLPVTRAVLFGSIARGDEHPTSDVDLLVEVRSRGDRHLVEDRLSGLSTKFALRFGNPLSTLVVEENARAERPARAFMAQALSEGIELKE